MKRLLIANRGEIALRIASTARDMGIACIAIYSEDDALSLHVLEADKSFKLSGAGAQAYLEIEDIIAAAVHTHADAIHPGVGFLSENADFAEIVKAHGITFIGPSAKAITSMGDKIKSKKIAEQANINVVPGFIGEIKDIKHAKNISKTIGFPVIIKASAGGGGKGMRIVNNEAEVEEDV